jgi:uncharacterized tellurite resistance protein B-like protein
MNPITEEFATFTTNQKMSVINMLQLIAVSDVGLGNRDKEIIFLNSFIDILGVPFNKCSDYFQSEGFKKIVLDLQSINTKQKELLAYIAWEMIVCDGKANEPEVGLTLNIFSQIGLSEENFVNSIEKNRAILNLIKK